MSSSDGCYTEQLLLIIRLSNIFLCVSIEGVCEHNCREWRAEMIASAVSATPAGWTSERMTGEGAMDHVWLRDL